MLRLTKCGSAGHQLVNPEICVIRVSLIQPATAISTTSKVLAVHSISFVVWRRLLFIFSKRVTEFMLKPRFLQIRLGNESCDQIYASPNRPKRAKSRDKTAGSLFTCVYTLVEFSQTKRCFFSFLKQNIQRQMIHQHHYRLHNTIHIWLKKKIIIHSSCFSAYSACDRQMQSSVVIGY